MLKSLYISNYALISELHIDFQSGFSVITGETGAGKSIILGALSLILGQRADNKFIKSDAEKCIIEAEFDISAYTHLDAFFADNDLDKTDVNCIIRRELTSAGKSRAFINDTPVALNVIRDLSNFLLDIHSQHENLLLSNESYQLEVVDAIARNTPEKEDYQQAYHRWMELVAQLKQLRKTAEMQQADLDYMQFQYQQLEDANLQENEQEDLELEQETLSHTEEIKTELQKTVQQLDGEQAALMTLKDSYQSVQRIKSYVPMGEEWYERLHSTYIEIKDILSEISGFEERLEYDPERLEWIQNRLGEIYTLQKKYKVSTVAELIERRDMYAAQLHRIDSLDEDIQQLEKQIEEASNAMKTSAEILRKMRQQACQPIENYLVEQLTKLGMPNIQFVVQLSVTDQYLESGADEVQFLFSANKNRPVQPVAQIASGGEISRVMLSIKSLVANKAGLPTIIFDEIDTGVSGEIAHRMGDIMRAMSENMQVITITHLPQIASKGQSQYRVYKDDSGKQTQTYIQHLTQEERIQELAQMLSGKDISEAAIRNAKEMLSL